MFTDDFQKLKLTGWFPGHMLKAGRQMQEALKLVDLVIELVDARAPIATRNPKLREMLAGKPFVIVANKADLADPACSQKWKEWFESHSARCHFFNARKLSNIRELTTFWKTIVAQERQARGAIRPLTRPIRIMIVGIPNIGKSTLVNHLHLRNKAQVGPKPGVTRQNQWVPLQDDVELLDTPGVLWPRIADKRHELLLSLLGNLSDDVAGQELTAEFLAATLLDLHFDNAWAKLGLADIPESPEAALLAIAKQRSFLKSGAELDTDRAAIALLKEFRDGNLGKFTLQMPEDV